MSLWLAEHDFGVSVLDFGADPTGTNDSTAAFNAAIAGRRGRRIRVPAGTYSIVPPFELQSQMWVGEVSGAGATESILVARSSSIDFCRANSRTSLTNLVFDGGDKVQHTLKFNSAHRTVVRNCEARGGTAWAVSSDQMNVGTLIRLTARNSLGGGFRFLGPNGMNFYDLRAENNAGPGFELIGNWSGETTFSGQSTLYGFFAESNTGPALRIRGVSSTGVLGGMIVAPSGADGVELDDNAVNVLIDGLEIRGDGAGGEVALRLVNASLCTFIGVSGIGTTGAFERARIEEPSSTNNFLGCSRSGDLPLDLEYTNGVASFLAIGFGADRRSTGVPTRGVYRQNELNWRADPTAAGNRGWRCTAAGTPGTWASF